jgi:hypothetical protein
VADSCWFPPPGVQRFPGTPTWPPDTDRSFAALLTMVDGQQAEVDRRDLDRP